MASRAENRRKMMAACSDELVAKEACYHRTCYQNFTRDFLSNRNTEKQTIEEPSAFQKVTICLPNLIENLDIVELSKLTGILESQELCEKEPEEEIGTWVCWNKFCTLSVKWLNSYWLTKITWRSKRFIRRRKINYKMYFIHPRWGKKTALVYHGLQQHQISRSKTFVTKVVRFTLQCCLMEASSQVQTNQDT